jgi:hypothetical protein
MSGSPGETILNKAGMTIRSENMGINIQVRFKKNPKLMLDNSARNKHTAYRHNKTKRFCVRRMRMMKRRKVTVFILGSNDCKRPFRDA